MKSHLRKEGDFMKKTFESLEKEINDFGFFLEVNEFISTRSIADDFVESPMDFMAKFLLMECIGKNYTEEELLETYQKVWKLLAEESEIESEELPILDSTTHSAKQLRNVRYVRKGNTWTYEKKDCR